MYVVENDIPVTVNDVVVNGVTTSCDDLITNNHGETDDGIDTDGDTEGDTAQTNTAALWVPFDGSGATKEGDTYEFPTGSQSWAQD